MKGFRSLTMLLLVVSIFTNTQAFASKQNPPGDACGHALGYSLTLSQRIEKIILHLTQNYTINRGLRANDERNAGFQNYEHALDSNFLKHLTLLGPQHVWFDFGSGQAVALRQYLEEVSATQSARVVAFALHKPLLALFSEMLIRHVFHQGTLDKSRFTYLSGKSLEAYSPQEVGRANLATDVYGPLSYHEHVDEILQHELDLLAPEGTLYTLLIRKQAPYNDPTYPRRVYPNVRILDSDGQEIPLETWLNQIEGVTVRLRTVVSSLLSDTQTISFTKTSDQVVVPKLELIEFKNGVPPHRTYRWNKKL